MAKQKVVEGLWALYPPEAMSEEEQQLLQQQESSDALNEQARKACITSLNLLGAWVLSCDRPAS